MYKKYLVFIFVFVFMLTGCGCEKAINESLEPIPEINEEVLKEQQVGNLKVYDVKMELSKDNTTFTIFMQNTSDNKVEINNFKINFKDAQGNLLLSEPVLTPFYSTIEAGEIQSLSVLVRQNLSNAVTVEYELVD